MVDVTASATLFVGNASIVTPYPIVWPSLDPSYVHVWRIDPGLGTVAVVAGLATFSAAQALEIGGRVRIGTTNYTIATRVSSTVYTFTTRPTISSTTFFLPDSYTALSPSDYTYTVDGEGMMNSFTTLVAIAATSLVLAFRQTPVLQLVDLPGAGALPAATLERMADREIMIDQELQTQITGVGGSFFPPTPPVDLPTQTFDNDADRLTKPPIRNGQLGYQIDTNSLYHGSGGAWVKGANATPVAAAAPALDVAGDTYYDTVFQFSRTRSGAGWTNSSPSSPFLLDLMQGTDLTPLDLRAVPAVQWQLIQGAGGGNGITIRNNGTISGAAGFTAGIGVYASSVLPRRADYSVDADILYKSNNGAFVAVGLRFDSSLDPSSTPNSGYVAGLDTSSGNWQLYRVVSGTAALLGQITAGLVANQTYRMRLEATGSLIRVYADGVLKISATDATITGPGKPVIWIANASDTTAGALMTRIEANDGEIAPVYNNDIALCWNGESLTGSYPFPLEPTIPQRVSRLLGTVFTANYSQDGKRMATINAQNATTMNRGFVAANTRPMSVAALSNGANNLVDGNTGAAIAALMATWVTAQRATGYSLVVVPTVCPSTQFTGNPATPGTPAYEWLALNTLILAGATGADLTPDMATDPILSNSLNTTYYFDGTHLTSAGKQRWAEVFVATLTRRLIITGATFNRGLSILGFFQSGPQSITLGPGVTTFAATRNTIFVTGDAAGNTIATITGVPSGTELFMTFLDSHVTFTSDLTGTADTIRLKGGATPGTFNPVNGDTLTLLKGNKFVELCRSVNT